MKNDGARRNGAHLLVAVAALLGLAACSATRLTDVLREPGHAGGPFRQVAVYRVRERLRAGGFDGAIVVRLGGDEARSQGAREAGSAASRAFADGYAAAQQGAGDAGRGGTLRLHALVYSVTADALVWSATSRPIDVADLRETTAGVARRVMEHLQEAGLLAET
jgi:hypothetical protein